MDKSQVLMRRERQSDGSTVCPHCKTVVEWNRAENVYSGCPFCTCPNCGRDYFDPDLKEIAIDIYEAKREKPLREIMATLLVDILLFIVALASINMEGLIGVFPFIFLIVVFVDPISVWKKKEDRKRKIDYLEGRAEERTPEVVESMNRLSNEGYLEALKANGVRVPRYFYQRLKGAGSNMRISINEDYSERETKPSQASMSNPFESKEKTKDKTRRIFGLIVVSVLIVAAIVHVYNSGNNSLSIRDLLPNIFVSSDTQEQTEKAEENAAAERIVVDEDMKGYVDGNTWYNEFLGIKLTLDEGWEFDQPSEKQWVSAIRQTETGESTISVTSEYIGQNRDSYTPDEFESMRRTANGMISHRGYSLNDILYGEDPFLGKEFTQIILRGTRTASEGHYANLYARFVPIVQKGFIVTVLFMNNTNDEPAPGKDFNENAENVLNMTEDYLEMFQLLGDGFATTGTMEGEWDMPELDLPQINIPQVE